MTRLREVDAIPLIDAGVIETLEAALAQAKAGEIGAVAIAVVHRDGALQAHYHWGVQPCAQLLGSLDRLRHKLNLALDE